MGVRRHESRLDVQPLEPRLALAGTSLGSVATAARAADLTPPLVASLTPPAAKSYGLGGVLSFRVNFSEKVVATGTPTLPVEIGGSVRAAAWNGLGSGSKSLTFTTSVQAGDIDGNGLRIAGPIEFVGAAAIKDAAGNSLNPAIPARFQSHPKVTVDAVAPTIASVGTPAIAPNAAALTVTFTETVAVVGKPFVPFTVNGAARQLSYASGSGTTTLTFRYKAARGEVLTAPGVSIPQDVQVVLPAKAAIRDKAQNALAATIAPPPVPLSQVVDGFLGATVRQLVLDQPQPLTEGVSPGAAVGVFSTIDCKPGATFTYELVPGVGAADNDAFAILNDRLVTTRPIDFETQATRSIRVRSTDQAGVAVERGFVLAVTDVNEAPVALAVSTTALITGQPAGSLVAMLTTSDPDAGDTFTYALAAGVGDDDNAAFTIVGNQLRTTRPLVRESGDVRRVRVRSGDSRGLSVEQSFDIAVVSDATAGGGRALTTDDDTFGVNPWSSSVTHATAGGRIFRKVVTYDAGDVTMFHFDPDDAHPWRSITEVYAASGMIDYSWTYLDDGTSVFVDSDQKLVNDWTTVVDVFDAAGNLDVEIMRFDDGSRSLFNIDQDNRSAFSSYSQYFNPAGQIERTLWAMDDGSSWSATTDPTGTLERRRAVEASDPRGRFDVKWSVNQRGGMDVIDDDEAGSAPWSSVLVSVDAMGRYLSIQRTNEDGTYARLDFDSDSSKPWAYQILSFTADGQLGSMLQGSDRGRVSTQTFDTNPAVGRRDIYDQAGRLDSSVEVAPDGSRQVIDFDQSGIEVWSRVTYNRLPNGVLDSQSVVMDDGSRRDTDFDQADGHAWRSQELVYDALGRLDYRWTIQDDGTKVFWDVDQAGQQDFSEVSDFYDAFGRLVLEEKHYRSGSRMTYEIDVSKKQAWATRFRMYDAADRLESTKVTRRDQTATFTKYDVGGADPLIAEFTDEYDAGGLVTTRDSLYDDGSRVRTEHDVDDSADWAYRITALDQAGNVDYVNTRLDDGSSRNVDYDSRNVDPREAVRTWWYDATGRPTFTHVLYDDGTEYSQQV